MSGIRLDSADSQNARVFVGNVAPNTDQDLLLEHFKKHGKISGVVVLKGFAFVQFEKEEDAAKAIREENGAEFLGKKIDVKVAKRRPVEERKDEPSQQQQHQQQIQQQSQFAGNNDGNSNWNKNNVNENRGFDNNRGSGGFDNNRGNNGGFDNNRGGSGGGFDNSSRGGGNWNSDRGGADRGRGGRGARRGMAAPYNTRGGHFGGGGRDQDDGWERQNRFGGGGSNYNDDFNAPPQRGGGSGLHRGVAAHQTDNSAVDLKNDCEIVCVNKAQRQYAEMIESRLRNIGLRVDVLFPNPDIPLVKILDNIASRGILFAIVVASVNEQHRSLTLNVLQGQQQEHRNMPLEDAMGFIAKNFEAAVDGKLPGVTGDVLPEDIRTVLGFLADNRPLSVMEYDKLIRYFSIRREGVLRMEYGDNIPPSLATPPVGPPVDPVVKAKQDELHERIVSILNRPPPKEAPKSIVAGSSVGGVAAPGSSVSITPELNASLQRAIDSLIKTGPNLLNQMQQGSSTGSQQQQGGGYLFSAYGSGSGRDNY